MSLLRVCLSQQNLKSSWAGSFYFWNTSHRSVLFIKELTRSKHSKIILIRTLSLNELAELGEASLGVERVERLQDHSQVEGLEKASNTIHPYSVKLIKKSKLSPEKSTFDLQREFFLHVSFTVSRSIHWFSALLVHQDQHKAQESSQTKELSLSTWRFLI